MIQQKLNAVVIEKIHLTPELIILRVAPNGWKIPDFLAGQYCAMGLPGSASRYSLSKPEKKKPDLDKLIARAYSLASPPEDKECLEIFVTLVPEGGLTPRLFNLTLGDRLWVSPKITGNFTFDNIEPTANVVLVSTGTGLAPYMSFLRSDSCAKVKGRVAVLHGVRFSYDLGYRSELEMLQKMNPKFTYFPTVSRSKTESAKWKGHKGYVQDIWTKGILDHAWGFHPQPEDTHFFLCGNPSMIDSISALLQKEGFVEHTSRNPGNLHIERYWT